MKQDVNTLFRRMIQLAVSVFRRRIIAVTLAGAMAVSCSACGSSSGKVGDAQINIEPYSKVEYNTEKVQSGDIQSSIELELKPVGYESKSYSVQQSDLTVQDVKVKEGDKVQKGDVMIQFEAKDIQKSIDEYTDQKEQDSLLIDHYTRLMAIDGSQDYADEIESAKEDMEVADTYITEQNERMKEYQVIAEQDGTVTFVNSDLQYGVVTAESTLITVDSGSSDYTGETDDSYEFKVGDTYEATLDEATFEMKVAKCEKYTSDATGLEMQSLTFEPVGDMAGVTEASTLKMVIQKPVVKNVIYVDKSSVITGDDDKSYVYVVDDNGCRRAVEVTVGDTVDDHTIIKEGLSAGEQVVKN